MQSFRYCSKLSWNFEVSLAKNVQLHLYYKVATINPNAFYFITDQSRHFGLFPYKMGGAVFSIPDPPIFLREKTLGQGRSIISHFI